MQEPCAAWQEKLAALHSTDLPLNEREALDTHVASCSACSAALADYKKIKRLINKVLVSKRTLPEWLMQEDLVTKLPPLPERNPDSCESQARIRKKTGERRAKSF